MDQKITGYLEIAERATDEIQFAESPRIVVKIVSKYISEGFGDKIQYAFVDRTRKRIYETAVLNSTVKNILPFFLDDRFISEIVKMEWSVIDPRGARLLFQKLSDQDIDFDIPFLIIPRERGKYILHFSVLWGSKKLEKIDKTDIDFIRTVCNAAEMRIKLLINTEESDDTKELKRTAFELRDLSGIGSDLITLGKEDFFGSMLLHVMGRALSKTAVLLLSTNENNTEYRVIASRGIYKKYIENTQVTDKMFFVRELKKLKGPVLVQDIVDVLRDDEKNLLKRLEASVLVPLVSKSNIIGILTLGERVNMQPYTEKIFDSIKIMSNQMVMAIENSRLSNIRYAFSRYVSPQLADNILSDPERIKLGGERRKATILFADIRGFTSMTERMKPEDVVDLLNTYLSGMSEIVFKYEGTLDKYIGDCVMAVFGAPVSHDNDTERAIFTSVEMQNFVNEINEVRETRGLPSVKIGIGMSTGEVIAGNMGSIDRMDYTVIGDVVNIASRLEGLAGPGQILVTKDVYNEIKYLVEGSFYDRLHVKGKEKPVEVYEIRDLIARRYLKTLEKREPYIIGHFLNVAEDAAKIASQLGFTKEEIMKLKAASMLIDIGRIGLNEKIFNKHGKLTPEEYEIVKSHVLRGAEYAEKRLNLFKEGIDLIKYHHECYDGSGYPYGLKGENIPLWARIVTIVDVYHALTSKRPHREPMSRQEAIERLVEGKGKCFDPKLVDIYVELLQERLEESPEREFANA